MPKPITQDPKGAATYEMAVCTKHGRTKFGTYFARFNMPVYGCLACHWEEEGLNEGANHL